jgi:asparagine synthetase B (glutamine-hydrolysing)
MCGFLVYAAAGDNSKIRLRGPDYTNVVNHGGLTFVHNLLHVTGAFTPQPFLDGDLACVYNGEIYNQPYSQSDGEVIIPLYKKYGINFARHIDGEFAIALYDFNESIAVFATDPFKTKPLFIDGIECSSYRSGVGGTPAAPNEIVVTHLDGTVLERAPLHTWDLTQWNDDYSNWIRAFDEAVRKRVIQNCFIGLSSGYDSGAIACAMLKLGVDFKAYMYLGDENIDVLRQRQQLVQYEEFTPDFALVDWLRNNIDNEPYTIVNDGELVNKRVLDDGAALGGATMAKLAKAEGRKVCLSGQGADEIVSDYSPWPGQSELKGWYPDQLRLWRNFNYGCQESYLMKEEYIGGAFGIETRYPFLDSRVVQEFLWLSAAAKNRNYKAPLREYLLRHSFPFEEGIKRGFKIELCRPSTVRRHSTSQWIFGLMRRLLRVR